ncbi:MAG: hypothetical protein ACFFFT_06225 [Candidatus Thorarchaeota archaeon]
MIFQAMDFLEVIANIVTAILLFLKPLVTPIGQWMVDWITATTQFFKDNLGTSLTFYVVVFVVLVVSAIIVNIIWPGDRPGSIFSKGIGKLEEFEDKIDISDDEDIVDEIKRCKDCGNPVGDSEICPLCGARQI